jgi:putative membrane protein
MKDSIEQGSSRPLNPATAHGLPDRAAVLYGPRMALDALLAILHHLAAFSVVGLLFAEVALLRGAMTGPAISRFGRVDGLYGIAFIAVVVVGIARVIWGIVPPEVYLANLWFWIKMAALIAVSLVSILPTVRGGRWRKALAADPAYAAPEADLALARRALAVELAILPVVPIAASLMARGFGAL